ncbi:unnamed protein product [Prorocentrum cordatum]|uniref:Uncharacterized protein n=1 Tax=Prorocentrum cordatum TaxID=2364126 RepID=A0ABN9ULX7_9DINO|nr:unnamed protein product [Polarella glacialis]
MCFEKSAPRPWPAEFDSQFGRLYIESANAPDVVDAAGHAAAASDDPRAPPAPPPFQAFGESGALHGPDAAVRGAPRGRRRRRVFRVRRSLPRASAVFRCRRPPFALPTLSELSYLEGRPVAPATWVRLGWDSRVQLGARLVMSLCEHAVAAVFSFVARLRPGDCDSFSSLQLVAPVEAAGGAAGARGLQRAPAEKGAPAMTNMLDDVVPFDSATHLYRRLRVLKTRARAPTDRVWMFLKGDLSARPAGATAELQPVNLAIAAHGLCRGGAPRDLLHVRGAPPKGKLRSRWASDSMLKLYAKQTWVVPELARVPPRVVQCGSLVSEQVGAAFAVAAAALAPPSLERAPQE